QGRTQRRGRGRSSARVRMVVDDGDNYNDDILQVSRAFVEPLAPTRTSIDLESSEILNQPTMPNSSSTSSASTSARNDVLSNKEVNDEEEHEMRA
ncbi:hypothetical protein U1Q18_006379, partial [Sarracenia purpurea var. burkii]